MPPSSKSLLKVNFIKNTPQSEISDKKLFVKGNDNNFDIILNGEVFSLDRKSFISMLKELKTKSNIKILNLDKNSKTYLNDIIDLINTLKPTQYFKIIKEDIDNIFGDIKDIQIGSVASYFTYSDSKLKNSECDPKNILSLVNPGSSCDDSSLLYADNIFHFLMNKKTPHAYIYIMNQLFNGFSEENIKELALENITHVTIIVGDNKNNYKTITDKISLSNIPKKPITTVIQKEIGSSNITTVNNSLIIILIIVALIILIILFIIFAKGYYRDSFTS